VVEDAFRTLGLGPGAGLEQVRAQYRRLAKTYHPDKLSPDPALQAMATARMKEINAAYRTLRRQLERRPVPPRRRPRTFDAMEGVPYRSGRPADRPIPDWPLGRWLLLVILALLFARHC
jgi:curved DNA-binding protein CbpA